MTRLTSLYSAWWRCPIDGETYAIASDKWDDLTAQEWAKIESIIEEHKQGHNKEIAYP